MRLLLGKAGSVVVVVVVVVIVGVFVLVVVVVASSYGFVSVVTSVSGSRHTAATHRQTLGQLAELSSSLSSSSLFSLESS